LEWETAVEVDNAGFNLYRAPAASGPYVRINDELIDSESDGLNTGATYQYIDIPPDDSVYYYQLEDIDIKGVGTRYDPVRMTTDQDNEQRENRIYLPLLNR
jgi:hypothetical protein